MGRLIYGASGAVDIEDRTLAHLQVVIAHKLRRGEPFMIEIEVTAGEGGGRRTFWVHPAVALQFHFFGHRRPYINRAWIDELVLAASRPVSLTITPEPRDPRI